MTALHIHASDKKSSFKFSWSANAKLFPGITSPKDSSVFFVDSAEASNFPLTEFLYEMTSTPTSLRLFWLLLILDKGELRFSLEILPLNSFSSCCTLSSVSPLKTNTSLMSSVSKWLEYPILMAVSGNKIQNVKKITSDTWDHGLKQKSSTRRRFFSFYSLFALFFS